MNADAQRVLDFWFGSEAERGRMRDVWFKKDAAFDRQIASAFGPLIEQALRGELAGWPGDGVQAALAQVVVLDQFTRNVYRDTPKAFAGDPRALEAAKAMCARGEDRVLVPSEQMFVYLPYEHAEDLATQDESVRRFGAMHQAHPETAELLDYAERHRQVIARFGRFPHRNAILGRASTAEEIAFLKEPGSRF